jgi:hypothetical protein
VCWSGAGCVTASRFEVSGIPDEGRRASGGVLGAGPPEQDWQAVGRDLERAGDHAFAGEFCAVRAAEAGAVESEPGPVAGRGYGVGRGLEFVECAG